MGVPFEALLPFGIIIGSLSAGAGGIWACKWFMNDGKTARWNLDLWDRVMMERDRRMTGKFRAQSSNHEAPKGFEVNNPWKLLLRQRDSPVITVEF
ncbi:NADH dehydrogenase [ubiquinone] 1 alpha subcomplex subunit 1 [Aspergillus homomorphus CBS 101889]|uniref:NADH dehydrogenase [ubiquinone] 1 alpha subcomplex subunit 1 n=1 Tax=Aspergillus homomorphus (strain CBS 101889) TaxID=1450537 RepID=A0A395IH81_ASPHC|nr:hypothetical protein BO97DRAFT_402128 [Aspergillus homomorphus CBS 101889]RAL17564.1 hypothetical protein BO97DRAFT_402128 [Aspergillus homomorphus CBS 101889]